MILRDDFSIEDLFLSVRQTGSLQGPVNKQLKKILQVSRSFTLFYLKFFKILDRSSFSFSFL